MVLLMGWGSAAFSQQVVDVDKVDGVPVNAFYTISGNPVSQVRFVRLTEGTPFFSDTWMKGVVISNEGKRYRSNDLRLNLIDGDVHFLTPTKEEYVCSLPLREVVLTNPQQKDTFRLLNSAFTPSLSPGKKGWYQPLVEGSASLYLYPSKVVQEVKEYGSSIAQQKIYTHDEYWLALDGALHRVKKSKDLLQLLPGHSAALKKVLDEKQNLPVAVQMEALVQAYNQTR